MCDKCFPYNEKECNKQCSVPQGSPRSCKCKLQPDPQEGCKFCPRHVPPPIGCGLVECPKKTECKECKDICPEQDEAGEYESGCFTWCQFGIFILFTTPVTPVEVEPTVGSPIGMSLCLQLKKTTPIPASFFKAVCQTNIICDQNPKGELVELCMPQNISLSCREGDTHTHIYQLTIVPTDTKNKDVRFKIQFRNLVIWAGACPRAALCAEAEKLIHKDCNKKEEDEREKVRRQNIERKRSFSEWLTDKRYKEWCAMADQLMRLDWAPTEEKKDKEEDDDQKKKEKEEEEAEKRKQENCGQYKKKVPGSEQSFCEWLAKRRVECPKAI